MSEDALSRNASFLAVDKLALMWDSEFVLNSVVNRAALGLLKIDFFSGGGGGGSGGAPELPSE
jgi:hypothetical protein